MQNDPFGQNWLIGTLASILGALSLWNWNKVNRDIRETNKRIDSKADKSEVQDIKDMIARNDERQEDRHTENIGRMDEIIRGQTAIWKHLAGSGD